MKEQTSKKMFLRLKKHAIELGITLSELIWEKLK